MSYSGYILVVCLILVIALLIVLFVFVAFLGYTPSGLWLVYGSHQLHCYHHNMGPELLTYPTSNFSNKREKLKTKGTEY